jgi:hypothetical protein
MMMMKKSLQYEIFFHFILNDTAVSRKVVTNFGGECSIVPPLHVPGSVKRRHNTRQYLYLMIPTVWYTGPKFLM